MYQYNYSNLTVSIHLIDYSPSFESWLWVSLLVRCVFCRQQTVEPTFSTHTANSVYLLLSLVHLHLTLLLKTVHWFLELLFAFLVDWIACSLIFSSPVIRGLLIYCFRQDRFLHLLFIQSLHETYSFLALMIETFIFIFCV